MTLQGPAAVFDQVGAYYGILGDFEHIQPDLKTITIAFWNVLYRVSPTKVLAGWKTQPCDILGPSRITSVS